MMIMSEFVYMCTCTFFSYMLVSSSIICNSCQELSFYETKQKCSKEVKAYQAKLQFYRTRQLEGSKSLEFDLKLKRKITKKNYLHKKKSPKKSKSIWFFN